ncbi:uncharacterized protein LOC119296180 isoform X3 [Triticum dicoccoides]|uniref:uncharacterized protein LOC119296180 isoform X3 n=1 Tax=Triticum dicoccoides TaxID=85692 RepID=UPI000E7B41FF|nr:uncharacterized protein LOC119296180 isoform X3 [Triticum dicoccoides]
MESRDKTAAAAGRTTGMKPATSTTDLGTIPLTSRLGNELRCTYINPSRLQDATRTRSGGPRPQMAMTSSFGPASLGRGLSVSSSLRWEALRGAWLWCCAPVAAASIGSKLMKRRQGHLIIDDAVHHQSQPGSSDAGSCKSFYPRVATSKQLIGV